MTLLIFGLILWIGLHFWKRMAPAHRARFEGRGKLIVTVGSFAAIGLMILGYRMAEGAVYWGRTPVMVGVNNLLMLLAFYLFAASGAKTRITQIVRHPQLMAVCVWSVAHLLVNGDIESFMLFGGMLVWALAEMVVISGAEGPRAPYVPVPRKKEVTAVVAAVVVMVAVSAIHILLGVNPFG